MKNQLRCYCAILFALLSIFFASALSVQSQTREAYVAQSEDKTTLTFYYDAQRNAHTGKTWNIEEVFTDKFGNQFPAWAGTYTKENTTVKKVIFDASFNKFRPTSTKEWFLHCSEMTQIDGLEHLNTDNVTNMEGMFYSCSNLTSLNLQHFNTEKVESMRVMFTYCSELTSLDLSNFNTAKVTDMFQMFAFCSKLTSIDLKNFNTSKVTDMQDMFVANSRLASLDLKSFNTDKVINMEGMFAACTALKYLDLSNFKPQKGTNMQQMFARSPALKTIRCNTNWATENSKSKDMFSGCVNLKGAVAYDANKTDATMANPETGYFTAKTPSTLEAYVAQSEDKTTLTFYYDAQRNAHTGKTWNIEEVFTDKFGNQFPAWAGTYTKENTTVKKVIFDASFNKFRPTSTKEWFLHCSEMTQIDGLEHLNTDNVTNMEGMFYSCSNLTSLNLQHFNTEKVESMRVMFTYCSKLTSLDLSNFNTAKVTDMFQMFAFCSKLTSIDLKNFNTSKVTDMQDMFVANSRLASLDLKSFNTDKVINMEGMFAACTALKYLDLSNFKPQKGTNMQQMFARSPALKTIRCNTNWATENSKSKDMFSGCVNLKGAVAYDANKTDATMANPETGYFTAKTPSTLEAYVAQSEDKTTLTFYYDAQRNAHTGKTWDIEDVFTDEFGNQFPAWAGTYTKENTTVKKVIFDASFNKFRPTSTKEWFLHCSEMTQIDGLEHLNTDNVTNMKGMFYSCSNLTSLNLQHFNTEKVESMRVMFTYCSELTSLDLSNFNTAKVTDMFQMFAFCSKLTSIDLKNFNTSKVTDMQDMFVANSRLASLDLKSFNTDKVINMEGMFAACTALKYLDLSNFKPQKGTNMQQMFARSPALKTIRCNTNWATENSKSKDMFSGCVNLKGAVAYDANKTDATMANPETGYFTAKTPSTLEAYVAQSEDKTTLTFYYDAQRNAHTGKTWDIEDVFTDEFGNQFPAWAGTYTKENTTVKKVIFDASFNKFRPTSTKEWFLHCSEMTQIDGLEHLNTDNVTNMKGMFYSCSNLTSLNLQHFNTEKVESMRVMFTYCSELTSLDLSNFNTAKVTDMFQMFAFCSKLTSIDLKNFNTSKVTDMQDMFVANSRLASLDLKSFNTDKVINMEGMFAACTALKYLDLSNFKPQKGTNMQQMFARSPALKTIRCNTNWATENSKSKDMFSGCVNLKGAVAYDANKTDATMANPETGYFTNESTAIQHIGTEEEGIQSIYTLQGKRVREAWKHLPAGVYVVNGKKIIK